MQTSRHKYFTSHNHKVYMRTQVFQI